MNLQKWWTDAGLGMMVHFGVYAVLGGEYKGKQCVNVSEWIQSEFRIPNCEYIEIAKTFNPDKFDADEWIKRAKDAGVDYIVFTTKHHDGFANFKTDASDFSLWNFQGRDIVAELRDACEKYGVHLGLYYSHSLDWHEKNGGGAHLDPAISLGMSPYNDWDYPDKSDWNIEEYIHRKSLPQVVEIMTNYAPDLIWFDFGCDITPSQAKLFYETVKRIKPECMVSGRISSETDEYGDFRGFDDNAIVGNPTKDKTETIITLNESWGYKKHDDKWKSPEFVIETWIKCASVNSNLSINVGPKPDGTWTDETVEIFKALAEWNKINGEAVHNVVPVFAPISSEDYSLTRKDNDLYLCFLKSVKEIELVHILSKVKKIEVLGNKYEVKLSEEFEEATGVEVKKITCAGDTYLTVIKLSFDEDIKFSQEIIEQNNAIVLKPYEGKIISKNQERRINSQGAVLEWNNTEDYITWDFIVRESGEYKIEVRTLCLEFSKEWRGGHKAHINVNGKDYPIYEIVNDGNIIEAGEVWQQAKTNFGTVILDKVGKNTLTLKADYIKPDIYSFSPIKIVLEKI